MKLWWSCGFGAFRVESLRLSAREAAKPQINSIADEETHEFRRSTQGGTDRPRM